jgi:hypothetical protein
MSLHPAVVPGLLGGGAVIAPAVGLDHEAEGGPVEVGAAADLDLRLGKAQARAADDAQEAPLELGLGEAEGVAVEELPQRRHAALAFAVFELGAEGFGVGEVEDGREVDQGSGWGGEWDAVVGGDIGVRQRWAAVDPDSRGVANNIGTQGDLDRGRWDGVPPALADDPPELSGREVAEAREWADSEDGRHPLALGRELGAPDRVDPASHRVQPALGDPVLDPHPARAEVGELPAGNHPMLHAHQRPDRFRKRPLVRTCHRM